MNVHKLTGESSFWREKCIVHLGSAWSIRRLHWPCSIFCDTASAEIRAFILLELHGAVKSCCKGSCQGSEIVFIQDVPATTTVNQACQCRAIQSPLHCYNI